MQLNEYQDLAMRTNKPLTDQQMKMLHAALGDGSETGELALSIYKIAAFGRFDVDNIIEELGDIAWYIACLCDALEWRFEELAAFGNESLLMADFEVTAIEPLTGRFFALSWYIGEIQTIVKANIFYDKPIDQVKMLNAAAMALYMLFNITDFFGHEPSVILEANIRKLSKRYPDKFSVEDANARADKVAHHQV